MLELRNISKRFSGIVAVDDVSFSARAGEITGYLGPNGSGKSTTMKMITGLIEMTSGAILFDGEPLFTMAKSCTPSEFDFDAFTRKEVLAVSKHADDKGYSYHKIGGYASIG